MSLKVIADVYQNQYLAAGAREINAIVSVSAEGSAGDGSTQTRVFGFIIDKSTSMEGERIRQAREATAVAIGLLQPTDWFFVVVGNEGSQTLIKLRQATADSIRYAQDAVRRIQEQGGTAIGNWLVEAKGEFDKARQQLGSTIICQAIMLTDGKNNNQTPEELTRCLEQVDGAFQCDCRGVGLDWEPKELMRIADKMLGTADIVAKPADLVADFTAIMQAAQGKSVSEVVLSLWAPAGAEVVFVKQTSPDLLELTDRAKVDPAKPLIRNYPTGAWGTEDRQYHLCIRVAAAGNVGDEMRVGRATLVYTENGTPTKIMDKAIVAIWTDDDAKSAIIEPHVAHATGQAELAQLIKEGTDALGRGDQATATSKLGAAVKIAHESGNEGTKRLLERVVEVEDAGKGTVRLRKDAGKEEAMTLETRSRRTSRISTQ
ncbi:MAG TPA: VWA domain-containing protein [Reyranella sp.]|nr:VWA domain-containing protein [Reyranella sp.]